MEWSEWKPFYYDIVDKLEINPEEDQKATTILSQLLSGMDPNPLITALERRINGNDVVVFGSGPSLGRHVHTVMSDDTLADAVHIAADGAISALREYGAKCDFVVTDLDGDINDIQESVQEGTIPIVHAHGDNIPSVEEFVPKMKNVLGSTQTKPLPNVFLWGGFTDGDRACFIASHYHPQRIILAGMDFGNIVGRWSKPEESSNFPASKRKVLKLEIAQTLLEYLWQSRNIEYYTLVLK